MAKYGNLRLFSDDKDHPIDPFTESTSPKVEESLSGQILRQWLSDLTCFCVDCKREILFMNQDHVVLHHGSHRAYISRFSPKRTCQSYTALYKIAELFDKNQTGSLNIQTGAGSLWTWRGRVGANAVLATCRERGILFKAHTVDHNHDER